MGVKVLVTRPQTQELQQITMEATQGAIMVTVEGRHKMEMQMEGLTEAQVDQ